MTHTIYRRTAHYKHMSPYAVLNALGLIVAAIGAGFAGGGLWVFVVVAAIFSIRTRSKRPNSPASAAVLLIPILLEDLEDLPLYLLWSAFVIVAVIPFKVDPGAAFDGYSTEQLPRESPVSLWTVWGGNTRTHLKRRIHEKAPKEESGGHHSPPASFAFVYSAKTDAPCAQK